MTDLVFRDDSEVEAPCSPVSRPSAAVRPVAKGGAGVTADLAREVKAKADMDLLVKRKVLGSRSTGAEAKRGRAADHDVETRCSPQAGESDTEDDHLVKSSKVKTVAEDPVKLVVQCAKKSKAARRREKKKLKVEEEVVS
jgi:hypothetical protein